MNTEIIAKAKVAVAPVIFQLKKHLPEILAIGGGTSIVGGTVLACRSTLKAKDILSEPIEVVAEYDRDDGEGTVKIHDEDAERKLAIERGAKIAVSYLPAVGMIGGGIAMMATAKHIEHSRFTAMLGAYSSLMATFEEYRGRVVAEGGPEMDYRCINGVEIEKVSYSQENPENPKKQMKVKDEVVVFTAGENPYHRCFDEFNSPLEWQDNMENNRFFLECQQTVLNQELKAKGRIFLSEVYERLGFEYNEVGQFVGWLADDIEGSKDGYIDFGIDYATLKREITYAQAEGRKPNPSIWLTFNCDGEVWDKPLTKKYDI